jgi:uncharacterized protein (DUF2062 family)
MALFGTDFRAARRQWLYDPNGAQSLLMAAGLAVGLLVLHALLQLLFAAIVAAILSGNVDNASGSYSTFAGRSVDCLHRLPLCPLLQSQSA